MKLKLLCAFFVSIIMPMNALAYSDYIIPGGTSVGIDIKTEGILVVGFYKIDGKLNKGNLVLKTGDKIIKVGSTIVNTTDELVKTMEKEMLDNKVNLTFIRDDKTKTSELELVYEDGSYKTELFVKDSITGIGTLNYIDPGTQIYGALGEITESNTNSIIEVKSGEIFRSSITSIDRSVTGTPGSKNAKFYSSAVYGNINKNSPYGIYGTYTDDLPNKEAVKVGKITEVSTGKAYIYTVLDKEKIGTYEIEITKVDKLNGTKNIYFEVTDKELVEKTGGIV